MHDGAHLAAPHGLRPSVHLYVHVPFCNGTCVYCGFYSERYTRARAERFIAAAAAERNRLTSTGVPELGSPTTVYLGGGTPSILTTGQLDRLLTAMRGTDPRPGAGGNRFAECTLEANPGTLPPRKLAVLRAAGVTRISLGVQSLDDTTLRRLGRRHSAADVGTTVAAIRRAGIANVGLDLIAGLPGVTPDVWRRTLSTAMALHPEHVSVYALSLEPESRLAREVARGTVTLPSDDQQCTALDEAERLLETAGYEHYETSNFALPGHRCRHNCAYWQGRDFIGIGPGASSRMGFLRWTNAPDLTAYARALRAGNDPPRELERVAPATDTQERLVFGFRLAEGIREEAVATLPADVARHWRRVLAQLTSQGLVESVGGRLCLTLRGRPFADHVARELLVVGP